MRTNLDEGAKHELHGSIQCDALPLRYDSSSHDLGIRVIEAVGAAAGVEETEITTPLTDVIDPEALDVLFAKKTRGQVSFKFIGYRVTIDAFEDGTGRICIE